MNKTDTEQYFKRVVRFTFGSCSFIRCARGFKVITEVSDETAGHRFATVCKMLRDNNIKGAVTDCFQANKFTVRDIEILTHE